jgi:hypothetical protein
VAKLKKEKNVMAGLQTEVVKQEEIVIRRVKLDSMGRTPEQVKAMSENDPRPLKLGEKTKAIQEHIGETCSQYPKVLYRLALKNGLPAGDVQNPDYPLPFDLAAQLGLTEMGFKVIGKNRDSAGHVVVRLPYITRLVGVVRENLTVDVEAARAEEARLLKLGWVDSPSKIKGLPTPPTEQEFDPLPDEEPKPNGTGRKA